MCVLKGFVFAIMSERIRTLDALLTELNRSPVCDRIVLPTGIRFLLKLDGTVVNSIDDLVHGGNYVCASTTKLRRIEYLNITGPTWNNSARTAEGSMSELTNLRRRYMLISSLTF